MRTCGAIMLTCLQHACMLAAWPGVTVSACWQAAAPALGAPQRRKPARNCLERSSLLQTIAVLIAACALTRLVLACYEESGLARLLAARRASRECPAGPLRPLTAYLAYYYES